MIEWFATLNFLHLLQKKYKLSLTQIGKILKIDRMTVYTYLRKDRLSSFQEYKIKKNIALWIQEFQEDFLQSYKKTASKPS